MSRSPRVSGSELVAALTRAGFTVVRIRGGHRFLRHVDGRATVVPVHSGETIGPGLLNKVMRDSQMTMEELAKLLNPR